MRKQIAALVAACLMGGPALASDTNWVQKSNEHAQVVLAAFAALSPEGAASMGVDGLDEQITDLSPGVYERTVETITNVVNELEARLAEETDKRVRQDLGILIKAGKDNLQSARLQREYMLPYNNINQMIFGGLRALIDPQVPRDRYPAAITRMEKYAGIAGGFEPITELAKAQARERFEVEGLIGPYRGEVEQDLERAETFITGIGELLSGTDLQGWEGTYESLAGQMRDYNDWIRSEILPRARDNYRLPAVMYEDALKNWGVEESPEALIEQATKGYMDIRNEMEALAPLVAADKVYDTDDVREVIALL